MPIKKISLQNYTFRYIVTALLVIIAVWAALFYYVITEEVYDNIDDGLKNSKLLILREIKHDPSLLNTPEYGIHQFIIKPLPEDSDYDIKEHFINTFEYMEYDEDNEPVRLLKTAFLHNGRPYQLTVRASMVEEDELIEDLATALVVLYVMLVISIALINRVIMKRAWKPFYNILENLQYYKPGKGNLPETADTNISEFKHLAQEINDLLYRNEQVYISQKQFIENASHELQTPLAISLNRLELFASNYNLDEQQIQEISKISDSLSRLVRLNKSLLMLSKIENRQFADTEEVHINVLAEQLIEDFQDFADFKNITLSFSSKDTLKTFMNPGLASALLSNLIKNAITHNISGGFVNVEIDYKSIIVSNSAIGEALDEQHIFGRFNRSLENEESTGLGLAIVKSICDLYRLSILYSHENEQHTFIIKFP